MFDNDNNDLDSKGLFTFYREQAEFEDKVKRQKNKIKSELKRKKQSKSQANQQILPVNQIQQRQDKQLSTPAVDKFFSNKSFSKLNKEYIKKLSQQNNVSTELTSNKFGNSVIIILKGSKSNQKQNLSYRRNHVKFNSSEGYFIKQRKLDFQADRNKYHNTDRIISQLGDYSMDFQQQAKQSKKLVRRNHSVTDRYLNFKRQLQTELVLNQQNKFKPQNNMNNKNDRLKRVDLLSQLPQLNRSQQKMRGNYNNKQIQKRIPPKALVSILKSQNHEMIRQLRKAIQKQKSQWKDQYVSKNSSSFIDYNNYRYQSPQNYHAKVNEKQRRLLNILNKFNRKI